VLQCAAVCCSVWVTHLRVHQVFNRKEMEAMAQIVRDNPRIDVISDEVQCVAMCCNVVQCVAVCCSVCGRLFVTTLALMSFPTRCVVLQCVAMLCSVLQCVAACAVDCS